MGGPSNRWSRLDWLFAEFSLIKGKVIVGCGKTHLQLVTPRLNPEDKIRFCANVN
jgi:uracil-DNA glycosylase